MKLRKSWSCVYPSLAPLANCTSFLVCRLCVALLCSCQRTVVALVLLRHLFSPYPRCLWPYVSLAFPLVRLNQEAGLSVPFAALPRTLFTGAPEPGPAGLGPVQWQWRHQRNQPRCLGEFLKGSKSNVTVSPSRQVVIWCFCRAHLKVSQLLRS